MCIIGRFYVVKKGIEIDSLLLECKKYLLGLMDFFEKVKYCCVVW